MTSSFDRITQQRLEKLNRIRARGLNPYPSHYHRTHTTEEAVALLKRSEETGQPSPAVASVAGRIMAQRSMGKISFLDVRDGSGKIQLLLNKNTLPALVLELMNDIDLGDVVGASGTLFRTRTGEPTVQVENLVLLTKSLRPLPEKWHGLADVEIRYRQRYLDLISNPEVQRTFKTRSLVIAAVRQFLNGRGFLEVETPTLQPSAGGALARPFVTHHNALDQDFYLRIATELHLKRLIVGGFDKVYEIGRIFRNEGIDTTHNPEFTMLESYETYADYNDVMKMVEEMVSTVCREVLGTTEIRYGDNTIDLCPPWKRLSLRDAVKEHCGIDFVVYPAAVSLRNAMREKGLEVDPNKNWAKLVDELLSTGVKPKLIQPTFIIDYPLSMSPLAKNKPGEERVVERFQAYTAGMEIANAYTELNDPVEQRERFIEQQKERLGGHAPSDSSRAQPREAEGDEEKWTIDDDFIQALEYGMPPTGGLGVGIDRLVMLLTNQQSIREVILFPQLREKG